jgi:hypothetical protein
LIILIILVEEYRLWSSSLCSSLHLLSLHHIRLLWHLKVQRRSYF